MWGEKLTPKIANISAREDDVSNEACEGVAKKVGRKPGNNVENGLKHPKTLKNIHRIWQYRHLWLKLQE